MIHLARNGGQVESPSDRGEFLDQLKNYQLLFKDPAHSQLFTKRL
jgi:hypothetical protein